MTKTKLLFFSSETMSVASNLPEELLEQIFEFHSHVNHDELYYHDGKKTLMAASLVNRNWSIPARRAIFSNLYLPDYDDDEEKLQRLVDLFTKPASLPYHLYVRHLYTTRLTTVELDLLAICRNLRTLDIMNMIDINQATVIVGPYLQELQFFYYKDPVSISNGLGMMVALQCLCIGFTLAPLDMETLGPPILSLPNLEELQLEYLYPSDRIFDPAFGQYIGQTKLRRLRVSGGLTDEFICNIIQGRCGATLTNLFLSGRDGLGISDSTCHTLFTNSQRGKLSSLVICDVGITNVGFWLLLGLSGLKSLTIILCDSIGLFGDIDLHPEKRPCSSLEKLIISYCSATKYDDLARLREICLFPVIWDQLQLD